MTCLHKRIERVKKDNGIQETDDPAVKLIPGNCLDCGTTVTMGKIVSGQTFWGEDHEDQLRKSACEG